jgi:serine/threonine protein kinase
MASTIEQEPEFVVEKPVSDNSDLRFVRRVADGDRYLAKQYDTRDFPELRTLREPKPDDRIIAFEAAARVLNHENLISVVKPMAAPARAGPRSGANSDPSLVYEFCADGNLQQLFEKPPMEVTDRGFLPEGLVWHVALSMLRAMTFLHEGWREKVVLSKDDDKVVRRTWYCPDDDWMPILHRSIRPENIYFQARKGKETYGLCKLGGFGRCIVAGTARVETEDGHVEVLAVLNNLGRQDLSPEEVIGMWYLAYEDGVIADWTKTKDVGDTHPKFKPRKLFLC